MTLAWVGLTAVSLVSFWSQAKVTEDRLVPALNVIADYYGMPDDIAGATLMAAGASSPELFSSIVALFVTHSSLGLGTIVGSEIFNQLVICAGAVYASKTGKLQLDRAIVTREAGFYALSILLLYFALRDVQPVEGDDVDHIFISFGEASLVCSGYLAYVLVCANMDALVRLCTRGTKPAALSDGGAPASYGTGALTAAQTKSRRIIAQRIQVDPLPFVTEKRDLSSEPASNWAPVEFYRQQTMEAVPQSEGGAGGPRPGLPKRGASFLSTSLRTIRTSGARSFRRSETLLTMAQHSECPSTLHDLYDVCQGEAGTHNAMSCFLWQKSFFYTHAAFGAHAWHLRWFTFGVDGLTSVPDRQDSEKHQLTYPHFTKILADEGRLLVKIINSNPERRDYTLMAPSPDIFHKVVKELEDLMEYHSNVCNDSLCAEELEEEEPNADADADPHVSLIEFPTGGSNAEIVIWLLLSPLRFAMHYTVPDVRHLDEKGNSRATIGLAYASTLMCLLWLIAGSLAMVASLEALAELMDIPDAVVGFTVSAAGTSLPNYVASSVSARNGFGNQAVSNAFGSNTFNIMIGLGLPWMMYTSFGTGFEPYSDLRNESILESIIIMGGMLLIFLLLMFQSGFVLYKWHGNLFILLYVAFLALEIGQVYLGGRDNQ